MKTTILTLLSLTIDIAAGYQLEFKWDGTYYDPEKSFNILDMKESFNIRYVKLFETGETIVESQMYHCSSGLPENVVFHIKFYIEHTFALTPRSDSFLDDNDFQDMLSWYDGLNFVWHEIVKTYACRRVDNRNNEYEYILHDKPTSGDCPTNLLFKESDEEELGVSLPVITCATVYHLYGLEEKAGRTQLMFLDGQQIPLVNIIRSFFGIKCLVEYDLQRVSDMTEFSKEDLTENTENGQWIKTILTLYRNNRSNFVRELLQLATTRANKIYGNCMTTEDSYVENLAKIFLPPKKNDHHNPIQLTDIRNILEGVEYFYVYVGTFICHKSNKFEQYYLQEKSQQNDYFTSTMIEKMATQNKEFSTPLFNCNYQEILLGVNLPQFDVNTDLNTIAHLTQVESNDIV